ncbi:MAG: hypothetical protein QOD84_1103 [Acidobacteriaceae bacterium]
MEGPSGFGIVSALASPVARQRSDCPQHREDQKRLAAGNTCSPGADSAEGRNHCRGRHSGRPHESLGLRTGLLHRGLVRLHAEEWEMLEHPTHSGGVAFRIARSSDSVEGEANAEKASDCPVCDAVAEEIEEEPRGDHHHECSKSCLDGLRQSESGAGGCNSRNLQHVSGDDRNVAEDLSLLKRT